MGDHDRDRQHERVEKQHFIVVKTYDEDGELVEGYTGTTLNVSEGGALVETENPLPFLSKVDLTLALDEVLIKLTGEVAHLKKREDGLVEMGFKFIDIKQEELNQLQKALKANNS